MKSIRWVLAGGLVAACYFFGGKAEDGMSWIHPAGAQDKPSAGPRVFEPQFVVTDMLGEKTALNAMRAALRKIQAGTGKAPTVLGGVAAVDGGSGQLLCEFGSGGETYKSLILADAGASRTVLFVDRSSTFGKNYPDLMRKYRASFPAKTIPWKLERQRLSDGSAIDLPATWKVTGDNKGMISAQGPEGSIDFGCATQAFSTAYRRQYGNLTRGVLYADYRSPSQVHQDLFPQIAVLAQQSGQPASRFAKLNETVAVKNPVGPCEIMDYEWDSLPNGQTVRWRSIALVITVSMGDSLMYYISAVHAPAESFPRHLRELLRVWASCTVSDKTHGERLDKAAASLREVGNIVKGVVDARNKAFDDALKNWGAAFREENVAVNHADGTVSAGTITAGGNFQQVLDVANQGAGWKQFELLNPKNVQ